MKKKTPTVFTITSIILCLMLPLIGLAEDKDIEQKFNKLYSKWKTETYRSIHSDTPWYTSRPSFKGIIELGKPVIPLLKKKLKEDYSIKWASGDFFLAFAVVEILCWKVSDFYESGNIIGEQVFAEKVLARLDKSN